MLTIKVGNSYSELTEYDPSQFKRLKSALSYESDAQAAFHAKTFVRSISLLDKKGFFPTGLLTTALEHFKLAGTVVHVVDVRKRPSGQPGMFKLNPTINAYADQTKSAFVAATGCRGTISMVTGYGKSIAMCCLINKLQVKTLVVVPNLELKSQLQQTFKMAFGSLSNITVENIGSNALKTAADYDCLILDEVHHGAAKSYHKLNKSPWKNIYYRFGYTATPFRNSDHEQLLLKSIAGDILYEVSYFAALKQKAIVPIEAYYIECVKKPALGYTYAQVYKELIVDNHQRNLNIAALALRLSAANLSTLVLVKEVAHGKALADLTGLPFANGQDNDTRVYIEQFKNGAITVLIGTTGILSEGVDTKPAEYVIVAGLGKAKSAFMQLCGRVIRRYGNKESGKVIIFKDSSHKWTKSHFAAQRKILLEEYGTVVVELTM